jgi:hypothetical protein
VVLQVLPPVHSALVTHSTHWPCQRTGFSAGQVVVPLQRPVELSHCWPFWQSLLLRHWTHLPPLQMGVEPPQTGLQVSSQLVSHTWMPDGVATQDPPVGQPLAVQR